MNFLMENHKFYLTIQKGATFFFPFDNSHESKV